jgi:soluble lytic murein transglycosylase-like protein
LRGTRQSAAENALSVEFFARVIWQESRFDAHAVSPKGAAGIAQFMPATASWHGLADPFGRNLPQHQLSSAFEQFRTSREVSE